MFKKIKTFEYNSKKEFADDLYLIWSNCFTYNTHPESIYRKHAAAMKKRTNELHKRIPEITLRPAPVDSESEMDEATDRGSVVGTDAGGGSLKMDESMMSLDEDTLMDDQPSLLHKMDNEENERDEEPETLVETNRDLRDELLSELIAVVRASQQVSINYLYINYYRNTEIINRDCHSHNGMYHSREVWLWDRINKLRLPLYYVIKHVAVYIYPVLQTLII